MSWNQFDREEEAIEAAYSRGDIDMKERNRQLRELHRDYRAAAQESAQDAYDQELERW